MSILLKSSASKINALKVHFAPSPVKPKRGKSKRVVVVQIPLRGKVQETVGFVNQLPAVIVPAEPYSNVNPTPSRSEDEIFSALADIVSRLTVTANNVEQAHTPAQFDRGAYLEELAIKESILRTLQQFHLSDDRFKEREMRWKEIEDQRLRAQLCKPRDVFSILPASPAKTATAETSQAIPFPAIAYPVNDLSHATARKRRHAARRAKFAQWQAKGDREAFPLHQALESFYLSLVRAPTKPDAVPFVTGVTLAMPRASLMLSFEERRPLVRVEKVQVRQPTVKEWKELSTKYSSGRGRNRSG